MRIRLSYANVAATLALVLSMSGGALAATHYLIDSTKQISPRVLKQLKGASGAAGKQGTQGPEGKQGPQGETGPKGETGAKGEPGPAGGPKGETGPQGKEGKEGPQGKEGKEGPQGKEGKEGPQGKEGKEGPQGKEGKEGKQGPEGNGFPSVLPAGKTEKGYYYVEGNNTLASGTPNYAETQISFPVPLASAPKVAFLEEGESSTTECPGSATEPEAAKGWLCIYEEKSTNETGYQVEETEPSRFGNFVSIETRTPGLFESTGTWAVTGS